MKNINTELNFVEAVNCALKYCMKKDNNVILFGLGADDPKKIFGSTKDLQELFGTHRVFDVPTSENALTGIGIGASLNGLKPVMVHQRSDFFLLAMDQIINSAAKWFYMFGNQLSVPITIRLIVGRGWGQGPTHSQSLHSMLAHNPGLKIIAPSTPESAYKLLVKSIWDKNPVIFIEHRWLHNTRGFISNKRNYELGKSRVVRRGKDVSLVAFSYSVVEAFEAGKILSDQGIECDILDIYSLNPIDWSAIFRSVRKTGRIIVFDISHPVASISSEVIAKVTLNCQSNLKSVPDRITKPDVPEPTGYKLTKQYYPSIEQIVNRVLKMFGKKSLKGIHQITHHDIPGPWFEGPF